MSAIRHELFAQAARACERLGPQPLARALLVDPEPSPTRDAEFGLLALADGSAGLYYAWLGGEQASLPARFRATELEGLDILDVCRLYLEDSDVERSLGLAAISAVTASVYRRAGYAPPASRWRAATASAWSAIFRRWYVVPARSAPTSPWSSARPTWSPARRAS